MTKNEILTAAEKIFSAFTNYCNSINETDFFDKPTTKWSVAENVQHLIISTNTSTLAYTLPKFLVRWIGGKPNRNSKTYEELVAKYKKKLAEGGAASGRFVPKPIAIHYGKERLMQNWIKATTKHIAAIQKNSTESDLNNYLIKHPLLGRITLQELCYFTIYHTEHHLNIISSRAAT
ncbi:DinB family protein [Ferruginibacter sp.]|nr:DinB family protein [Ferruginibacter sp.]